MLIKINKTVLRLAARIGGINAILRSYTSYVKMAARWRELNLTILKISAKSPQPFYRNTI